MIDLSELARDLRADLSDLPFKITERDNTLQIEATHPSGEVIHCEVCDDVAIGNTANLAAFLRHVWVRGPQDMSWVG